ncbi:hypothetical protein BDZ91DRAFT_761867 [Kalaharituber pfeilii]|nr:hypothetical protein BDZ91DRAFT_761867 [Kalaharituber pfeilii]
MEGVEVDVPLGRSNYIPDFFITVQRMMFEEANSTFEADVISKAKETVYVQICNNESNNLRLLPMTKEAAIRKQVDIFTKGEEIFAVVSETGSKEEFIVIGLISTATENNYRSKEDMKGNIGKGVAYGVATTGDDWRMLSYDDITFRVRLKFNVIPDGMEEDKEWMKDYSTLIECYNSICTGSLEVEDRGDANEGGTVIILSQKIDTG